MNLFRLLLIAGAIWLVWRLLRGVQVHISRIERPAPPVPGRPDGDYEPMAKCARCGVHLPASALSPAGLCGKCASDRT